jgi:large subunit ribosomal protein L31
LPKIKPEAPPTALVSQAGLHYSKRQYASRRSSGRLCFLLRTRPMKADTHPNYHMIKVIMTNGTEFFTRSTYGAEGATLNLDIDPNTHPAWTGGSQQLLDRGGRLSRFNSRFAGLSLGGGKK